MARLFFQCSGLYRSSVRSTFLVLLVKSRLLLVGSALLLQLGVVIVTEVSSGNMVAVPIRVNIIPLGLPRILPESVSHDETSTCSLLVCVRFVQRHNCPSRASKKDSGRTKTNGKVKDEAASEHLHRSVGNLSWPPRPLSS